MDVERLTDKVEMARTCIGGLVTQAVSGIGIALLDITGKTPNLPVYRLLGGKFTDKWI